MALINRIKHRRETSDSAAFCPAQSVDSASGRWRSWGWLLAGGLNLLLVYHMLNSFIMECSLPHFDSPWPWWYTFRSWGLLDLCCLIVALCSTVTCFLLFKRKNTRSIIVNEIFFFAAYFILLSAEVLRPTANAIIFRVAVFFDDFRLLLACVFIIFAWKLTALLMLYMESSEAHIRIMYCVFAVILVMTALVVYLNSFAIIYKDEEFVFENGDDVLILSTVLMFVVPLICMPLLMYKKYHNRFWRVLTAVSGVVSLLVIGFEIYLAGGIVIDKSVCNAVLESILFQYNIIPLLVATPIVCLDKKPL